MDAFFSGYDRWQGLIPLLGGVYATLLAYGVIPRKPKDPERLALWHKKFGPMMRKLGPALIFIGLVTVVMALAK